MRLYYKAVAVNPAAVSMRSGRVELGSGPAILLHGGAWDIPSDETDRHIDGMVRALEAGIRALEQGRAAEEVVVEVVATQEASGVFDAGSGSVLTRTGIVEMDAGVMRGEDLAFGAVGALRTVAHPIKAAHLVLESGKGQVRFMAGREAERHLHDAGIPRASVSDLIHPREQRRWEVLQKDPAWHTSEAFLASVPRGTVGCVVRDARGQMAAGTSTGGTPFRPEGRVGDSPLPGCGYYADRDAAASSTGWGEAIASAGLAGRAVAAVERGVDVLKAAEGEIHRMRTRISNHAGVDASAGLILLSSAGPGAWAYNTPRMARGAWSADSGLWTRLDPAGPSAEHGERQE
ncbi:MAG: asparaginase [Rhodothermales bacterium]|nr:asparaginase [Rhodothermales bacterium]